MKNMFTIALLGLLVGMPVVRCAEKRKEYRPVLESTGALPLSAALGASGYVVGHIWSLDHARTTNVCKSDRYGSYYLKPNTLPKFGAKFGFGSALGGIGLFHLINNGNDIVKDASLVKTLGTGAAGWSTGCLGGALYGAYEGYVQKKLAPARYEKPFYTMGKHFPGKNNLSSEQLLRGASRALYRSAQARKFGAWAGLLGTAATLELQNQLSNKR